MSKIDKSRYTKKQWKLLKEFRRKQKQETKQEKDTCRARQIDEQHRKSNTIKSTTNKESGIAFVIGNGVSRKPIDLFPLKDIGKVYGCNALYREYEPDFLVAVDTKMILEINKSGFQKNHEVWTNPNKAYSRFTGFNYFDPSKGWSSGPTALWLASEHNNHIIYILGFDYTGLNEGKNFNNVYANTKNYKKSTDSATFFGNWMRQTATVIQNNTNINYLRVVDSNGYIPKDLKKFDNLKHITVDDFQKVIKSYTS